MSCIYYLRRKRNIVVTSTGDCLLCDFGLSRIRHEVSRTLTTIRQGGRLRFVAPEISSAEEEEDSRTSEPSDIYSLAMTIYTLGTRSPPFGDISEYSACRAAREGRRPSKPALLGWLMKDEADPLWSLIERMWDQQPRFRPPILTVRLEVLQHLMHSEPTTTPSAQHSTVTPFLPVDGDFEDDTTSVSGSRGDVPAAHSPDGQTFLSAKSPISFAPLTQTLSDWDNSPAPPARQVSLLILVPIIEAVLELTSRSISARHH